jgi:hypothetical protein
MKQGYSIVWPQMAPCYESGQVSTVAVSKSPQKNFKVKVFCLCTNKKSDLLGKIFTFLKAMRVLNFSLISLKIAIIR